MSAWLSVVGLGEEGLEGLSPAARRMVETAEVLIGGDRHLAMLPEDERERLTWPQPLLDLIPEIERRRGRRVCVLATGDPLAYGIASTLLRFIDPAEMLILPAPSAFSLACARLGWPLHAVETITLHGRPLALLQSHILPGARLVLLTDDGTTPAKVAALLRERGYGPSALTVLEHMGGPDEQRREGTAADWGNLQVADFHTLAVDCRPEPGAPLLPKVPGLPDTAFKHDGQMTKREVRAATLAALAPVPGQRLWDVGAGCGSIAIEWMRAAPGAEAIAIERAPARAAMIAANSEALGTPKLSLIEGEAPGALEGLPAPDAVFLGGGLTASGLFDRAWAALGSGGRLVANAVTLEGEQALAAWHGQVGGSLTRIAVSRAEPVGGRLGWRPLMTVTQFAVEKP